MALVTKYFPKSMKIKADPLYLDPPRNDFLMLNHVKFLILIKNPNFELGNIFVEILCLHLTYIARVHLSQTNR